MKKIFLLLTIIFSQAQVCLTNSEDLTSQVITENKDQNPTQDKKKQTWREYCNNEVAAAKNELKKVRIWSQKNPKKAVALFGGSFLLGALITILTIEKITHKDKFNELYKARIKDLYLNMKIIYLKLKTKKALAILAKLITERNSLIDQRDQLTTSLDPNIYNQTDTDGADA